MYTLWQINAFWFLLVLLHLSPIHHCESPIVNSISITNQNIQSSKDQLGSVNNNIEVIEFKSKRSDKNNKSNMADNTNELEEFSRRLAIFSLNVYNQISLLEPNKNIIFSPFSIQTCAAMARMGAKGGTAEELDRGLGLISNDNQKIAQSFHNLLATYQNSNILRIANKIFVMKGYGLKADFNKLLTEKFLSAAENLDFSDSRGSAATINKWVEEKTNNLIKNLIDPGSLDSDSRLVLVNAVHFKGIWVYQFPEHATRDEDFYINNSDKVKVSMMNIKEKFGYADLPELNATALELPYKDSDLSMLIILPKEKTGLPQLEEKLRSVPLSEITKKLSKTTVVVKLPKFKAEFQIELTEVFRKLGMPGIFSGSADFSGMLESPEPLKVSKIIHKAFIDVNEQGTEAAAATGISVRKKRCITSLTEPIEFIADHPFTYALVHQKETPLFWGSVIQLESSTDNCPTTSQEHDEL